MATDTSKTTGDWSSASTWNHGVPGSGATVDIAKSDDVTLSGAANVGSVTVASGGELLMNGGTLTTTAGLTVTGEVSGSGVIDSAITGAGTVEATNGVLNIDGAVGADDKALKLEVGGGATLQFDGAVGATNSILDGTSKTEVSFTGGNGVLDLSHQGAGSTGEQALFQAEVAKFAAGDQILVAGSGSAGDTVHFNAGDHMLSVASSSGALMDEIELKGNYAHESFTMTQNNGVDTITANAICFMAGVMIRTPDGEVAVESLKRGDLVLTYDGLAKPLTWLGRQTLSTVSADLSRVGPIRVRAGALAENVPSRDLLLSPDHALLVDDVLIHAGVLVNGSSIVREVAVPPVFVYYHVELDDHSLILAENTPAETFMNNVERLAFDNWAEHDALYPNGKEIEELPNPRAKARRQVPSHIRVALQERARILGWLQAQAA